MFCETIVALLFNEDDLFLPKNYKIRFLLL